MLKQMADTTLLLGFAGIAGTIGGTVAGASISARVTLKTEQRREKRDEARDAAQLRMAIRLLRFDLMTCDANLIWTTEHLKWNEVLPLPTDAWEEHRGTVARHITDSTTWDHIALTMKLLEHFKMAQARLEEHQGTLPAEPVAMVVQLREALRRVDVVLGKLAGSVKGPDYLGVGTGRTQPSTAIDPDSESHATPVD